jgi:hypothetical protein
MSLLVLGMYVIYFMSMQFLMHWIGQRALVSNPVPLPALHPPTDRTPVL